MRCCHRQVHPPDRIALAAGAPIKAIEARATDIATGLSLRFDAPRAVQNFFATAKYRIVAVKAVIAAKVS